MGLLTLWSTGLKVADYNDGNVLSVRFSFGPGWVVLKPPTSFVLKVLQQVKHTQMKLHNTNCVMKLVLTKYLTWLFQLLTSSRVDTVLSHHGGDIKCVLLVKWLQIFFYVNQLCVFLQFTKELQKKRVLYSIFDYCSSCICFARVYIL